MNIQKTISLIVAFLFLVVPFSAQAEDKTYNGSLSGVECTACKRTVSQALAKLDGVKTIRIIKETDTLHRLEVLTDGKTPISKAQAEKALEKANHYEILSWAAVED